jgi:hypothetical protein
MVGQEGASATPSCSRKASRRTTNSSTDSLRAPSPRSGGATIVYPGFPGDSVPWIPGSLVVWSCAASARSKSWAPVSERAVNPGLVPPRERRHGRRLEVRDVPPGAPSRAEDELLLCRRRSHSEACVVVAVSDRTDGGNRADLCQARGLADASVPTPGIEVGPIEGERETAMERTPAEPGHLEGPEDRLDRHLRGDLPADDHAAEGVDEHRRRPSLRWCGRR